MRALTTLLCILPVFAAPKIERTLDLGPVWSGHPVGFALLTQGQRQFVAYYDAERHMTVAARTLSSSAWRKVRLPSKLGWDSHNSIVLAADDEGYLHLSGNMHVIPLVYFRTAKPWDIETFEPIHQMTGADEIRCTYPVFFRGPKREFLFTYRDGRSGSGNQLFNVYDTARQIWRRLLDTPLLDGRGRMNAYPHGPVAGPDGYFHLLWVWRNTPDCSTNHDLSYARSRDLVHWETSAGRPLALPITLETGEVVDAVPMEGGMINGCERIAWDRRNRPLVSYHKFDEKGLTQAYIARLEEGRWVSRRVTDWDYRWDFRGGGAIVFEIGVGPLRKAGPGELALAYRHVKRGEGRIRLDEESLQPLGLAKAEPTRPAELEELESDFPGMEVRFLAGAGPRRGTSFLLRWETLPANRDRPRTGPLPGPSMLRLYELTGVPGGE